MITINVCIIIDHPPSDVDRATVELLAARGADLNQEGCDGARAVQLAARNPRLLKWLLDHGANNVKTLCSDKRSEQVGLNPHVVLSHFLLVRVNK